MKRHRLTKEEKLKESLILLTIDSFNYQLNHLKKEIDFHRNKAKILKEQEPLFIFFIKHKI